MVKKPVIRDKNQLGSRDVIEVDRDIDLEPYTATGKFHADFAELCERAKIDPAPVVRLRPKPPGSPEQKLATEGKADKMGKAAKGKPAALLEKEAPDADHLDNAEDQQEPQPTTFTLAKDKFEYFAPSVQVDMDHPEKQETVTAIFIRGWKLDVKMMAIFNQCLPLLDRLHTVNLWNVALTADTLESLNNILLNCVNTKHLTIDGTPVAEQNFHILINGESNLQYLSLCYCQIDDRGAERLANALGNTKQCNTKLLHLLLNGNHITDIGGSHLASALRLNRTLLSLSLVGNQISNKAAIKMAESLSRFALSHEEIVTRRQLFSERNITERRSRTRLTLAAGSGQSRVSSGSVVEATFTPRTLSAATASVERSDTDVTLALAPQQPPPSRRSDKFRLGSGQQSADKTKVTKDKAGAASTVGTKGKKDVKAEKEDHSKSKGPAKKEPEKQPPKKAGAMVEQPTLKQDKTKGKDKTRGKDKKGMTMAESTTPETFEVTNPLLDKAEPIDGELWIPGNRVLVNLNLAYNLIGNTCVEPFLSAMQYQETLIKFEDKAFGTGLLRLNLTKNNNFNEQADNYIKLQQLMRGRDPAGLPIRQDISRRETPLGTK